MKTREEIVYIAYRNKQVFVYSYDINAFFTYLKSLYERNSNIYLELEKKTIEKCEFSYQSLYPEEELVEFVENEYMPIWEYRIWRRYWDSIRLKTLDLTSEENKNNPALKNVDNFLYYVGYDKVKEKIKLDNIVFEPESYLMDLEFSQIIEDK